MGHDFARDHAEAVAQGRALSVPHALRMALRAKNIDLES
jgi:hypothetical protein